MVRRYHPSWMIPTVIVPTMNSVSSQILARRKQKSIPFSCLPKANKRLIPLAPLPNSLCLARTRSWQRISRTSTCEASPLTRKPRTVFTSFIPMVYVSRATWWRCESISTIDRPSTFMEKSTRDWWSRTPSSIHPKSSWLLVREMTVFGLAIHTAWVLCEDGMAISRCFSTNWSIKSSVSSLKVLCVLS